MLRGRLDRPRRLTSVWHYGPVDSRGRIGDKLEIIELLYRYVRDEGELRRILVDNPSRLFGYEN
mgnify:CR=1 FL=1